MARRCVYTPTSHRHSCTQGPHRETRHARATAINPSTGSHPRDGNAVMQQFIEPPRCVHRRRQSERHGASTLRTFKRRTSDLSRYLSTFIQTYIWCLVRYSRPTPRSYHAVHSQLRMLSLCRWHPARVVSQRLPPHLAQHWVSRHGHQDIQILSISFSFRQKTRKDPGFTARRDFMTCRHPASPSWAMPHT